jgi:hypothetical protein
MPTSFIPLVIPAKAGIQNLQNVTNRLDSGFRRSDGLFHGLAFFPFLALSPQCW